ncbi:putative DsbA family dithiol-disulfide isomerase [Rhabdobacter roseus]|uniref:Putative DsbA family dithiol-disulfide isomerase n=1 Tax=Rhabdobacter roseus TaxID=1655419 RepID=A0A840TVN8_9BACT|nr:DsbA family oxidoreductase [Rhabdobacter roseus]MBB5284198.1 putative DsbA family dithiol-disulfide isomerase [Rhabdobacter roseus]
MDTPSNQPVITIDIVSDVVCPWCYVGKKRLEAALATLQADDSTVRINWHPYQLDPTIPEAGYDRQTYFLNKFGSEERIQQMFDHLTGVGEEVGIDFRLNAIPKAINTFPLHKLLQVAGREGFQPEAEEKLFAAYFTQALDLTQVPVLAELFAPYGWSEEKIKDILADDALAYEVRQEITHFQSKGISGVPFFIINNKYGLSGAQPSEVFVEALTTVREEMLTALAGASCGPEGC